MSELQARIEDFLAQKHIAVAGVRSTKDDAANLIYRKLRETGRTVYAINPNAQSVEGDPCYPDLASTPQPPTAVMIVTRPEVTDALIKQCAELGIQRVWVHNSFMGNSLSPETVALCKAHNIKLIPGLCPMMFVEKADFFHKAAHWFTSVTGKLPQV